ncbi:MAG: TatD family hydrolase [Planctomycetota bacterium]|jgi:predicted metal-dependent TIM-barrel fold hydrolase
MFIEPHIHMGSRTTDDYEALAAADCRVVVEPAFWAGFDRCSVDGFRDYFRQLMEVEPARAARYSIDHYCWLCINPKEAENLTLAREVMALIPESLGHPRVLGIGEIGLNRNTVNELTILEEHLELAAQYDQLVLVHSPHLEDKLKGTRLILDAIRNQGGIAPERVLIDHCEEHTLGLVRDAGMWAGLTLYPHSKCSPARAVDMLEVYGTENIWLNSAADWGVSNPLSLPMALTEMRRRGMAQAEQIKIAYANAAAFLSQSGKVSWTENG